jgi:hypothetical protein
VAISRKVKARRQAKRRGQQIAGPVPQPTPQLIDLGKSVPVTVKKASAEEIVLTLSDGTKLQLKPVVMGIERSVEKFNPMGDPIYQINVGIMIMPRVPRKLKQKLKRP